MKELPTIEELKLTPKLRNILLRYEKFNSLEKLTRVCEHDLLDLRNLGKSYLAELVSTLKKYELGLRPCACVVSGWRTRYRADYRHHVLEREVNYLAGVDWANPIIRAMLAKR